MKIGLYGPYGFGNLGDAAIQQAMIQNIRKRCKDAKIYGISLNPEDTEIRHEIPSYPIRFIDKNLTSTCKYKKKYLSYVLRIPSQFRNNVIAKLAKRVFIRLPQEIISVYMVYKFLKGFDLLIASGGGQLDDSWGGPCMHPLYLLEWAILAKLQHVKFLIVSVGASTISSPVSQFFLKHTLLLASYRSFRDPKSLARVKDWGVKKNNYVFPDLAYGLEINEFDKYDPVQGDLIVGISPIAYYDPRVWSKKDPVIYNSYLTKLTKFISWLLQNKYQVVFCPSQFNHERAVIQDIKNLIIDEFPKDFSKRFIDQPILTVDELLQQISKVDVVIASRYHSVSLSHLMNKPVIALSYDEKVDSIMENMDQTEYCLSIENFDVDDLIDKFCKLTSNSREVKDMIKRKIEDNRYALNRQYDQLFGI